MTEPIVFELEQVIQPEQTFTYINLPFEVPERTSRIDVAYSYDAMIGSDPSLVGGNTIDIGISDSRGSHFMTQGFRGWSGSARQKFFIAEDKATPGYLAGPIQSGRWAVCLGVYKVAPQGCHCKVTITLTLKDADASPVQLAAFPAMLPVKSIASRSKHTNGWYKGEIHCHTVHSDGDSTVNEVIQIAESAGLDFLAITDHNNRSHLVELAQAKTELTLIPGYEVTTYYGHWNIWGLADWIDFRVQTVTDMQQAMQTAQDQGYLVSCNHPRPYGPDWAFPTADGFSCVEVWNGPWQALNDHCLAFWEARLNAGQRLVAVGGSDFHFSHEDHIAQVGHPTVYIHCTGEPSASNLLEGLRAGHAFISDSPSGPRIDLQIGEAIMGDSVDSKASLDCMLMVDGGAGSELQIITNHGRQMSFTVTEQSQQFHYSVAGESTLYVRAQLYDPSEQTMRAITNPIYFNH